MTQNDSQRTEENHPDAYTFAEVLQNELKLVVASRSKRFCEHANSSPPNTQESKSDLEDSGRTSLDEVFQQVNKLNLTGLALSGGGIRSATLNLGIIQSLAELRLLKHFDYLSTVSGGGYIGSWLSAWISRQKDDDGIRGVERDLADKSKSEPQAIKFLREYSNYLTPESSLFSADTWTAIATYSRNSFLNLLLLTLTFAAVLVSPRWITGLAQAFTGVAAWNDFAAYLCSALLLIAMVLIGFNLNNIDQRLAVLHPAPGPNSDPSWAKTAGIQRYIVAPILVAALIATVWLVLHGAGAGLGPLRWAALIAAVYFVLVVVPTLVRVLKPHPIHVLKNPSQYLLALPVGAAGGFMLYFLLGWLRSWELMPGMPNVPLLLTFGPPLMILYASTVVVLHVGLTGRLLRPEKHEWWLRLSAWLGIYSVAWIVWFGAAFLLPLLFFKIGEIGGRWLQAGGLAAWITITGAGIWAGHSSTTGPRNPKLLPSLVADIAPYVFVIGFVGLIAVALHYLLLDLGGDAVLATGDWAVYWREVASTLGLRAFLLCLIGGILAMALAFGIDINIFSLHYFYRNRLIRAYLGATRGSNRKPNPFTGFDPNDNVDLACRDRAEREATTPENVLPPDHMAPEVGPYHLVNVTLNLVKDGHLAWQERKAAPFIFSPLFCGYEIWSEDSKVCEQPLSAYRRTECYAQPPNARPGSSGLNLGTALAISGAAFNPNMGYASSPASGFLLTVFSARLGVWLGNPGHPTGWKKTGPMFSLYYLVLELFGLTDEKKPFVNLSDGGHFENLGIYELIRRRCRYIVAIDGGQDGEFSFDDLGNAIRKCRTDFQTEITIKVSSLCPQQNKDSMIGINGDKRVGAHWAIGQIEYPDGTKGTLLYCKATLTGDEPTDLLNYATSHPEFPHQSTLDQWFTESQFESYRRLGQHIGHSTFDAFRREFPEDKPDVLGRMLDKMEKESMKGS